MKPHHLQSQNLDFTFIGPSIDKGPMPALFYFALSAHDTLFLSPFNQPIKYFEKYTQNIDVRIFSTTIPGHQPPLPKEKGIEWLAEKFKSGLDPLEDFIKNLSLAIEELVAKEILIPDKIIVSGLSRGALIASMLAVRSPFCNRILGFAPLTTLEFAQEFQGLAIEPLTQNYRLKNHLIALAHKKIRFYIGNHDTRVKTESAFDLITSIASYAHAHRIKGSYELFITNSIGYMGHGTSDETFREGALWAFEELFYHG